MTLAADQPLACSLNAIGTEDRPRYADLVKRLRSALVSQSEIRDGYAYTLDANKITLPEVAEWITMERLCCPFLTFRLNVNKNGDSLADIEGA